MNPILERLISDSDPCLRYKARLRLLGEDPRSASMCELAERVKDSPRLRTLLQQRGSDGRIPGEVYAKFTGAHWVLSLLAEFDYPPGDASLIPLRDQVYENWLSPAYLTDRVVAKEASSYKSRPGVPWIQGRARRCASQQGNALWSTLKLGLADDRADELARKLIHWQWPDGGWNCDRRAEAANSSFHESLIPLRALALHGRIRGEQASSEAALRAAEIFLKRHLFKRQRDGEIIREDFVQLHYPCYWHYDFLFGLKVMAEAGLVGDPRCAEALDLLESKRLPEGGYPAERKYYRVVPEPEHGGSLVDWGGTSKKRMNPWVTLDVLVVLQLAGRTGL
jgi:hypothetical protein